MAEIIKLIKENLATLNSFQYFIIIALVLLALPVIYKTLRAFYKDRLEAKDDLIKSKNELLATHKERFELTISDFNNQVSTLQNDIDQKTDILKSIASNFRKLDQDYKKLSDLNRLVNSYSTASLDVAICQITSLKSTIDMVSFCKSMIILLLIHNAQSEVVQNIVKTSMEKIQLIEDDLLVVNEIWGNINSSNYDTEASKLESINNAVYPNVKEIMDSLHDLINSLSTDSNET
ncbi:hypothetical protein [Paenibacillus elgii]|uniref:hypothetical protein n=1 Tax=Paenibacillus elgii TaxID=189691 RepID=UPI000FD8D520|nr:hypothetical protein [Paenibacillus elgii]NEN84862.1 hypothetical protein [Paenibacillus elgii]